MKSLSVQDRRGDRIASVRPSGFLAWRKQWAAESGRAAKGVGLVVDTPGGERLVASAAELRRLLPSLAPGESSAHVVALCALPAELQAQLEGSDVWKAV